MCSFQGTSSTSVLPHLLGSLKINQKIFKEPGSHLLSHAVSSIVPSAAQVLTIVFGMGTGVSPRRIATGMFVTNLLITKQYNQFPAAFSCQETTGFLMHTPYGGASFLELKQLSIPLFLFHLLLADFFSLERR